MKFVKNFFKIIVGSIGVIGLLVLLKWLNFYYFNSNQDVVFSGSVYDENNNPVMNQRFGYGITKEGWVNPVIDEVGMFYTDEKGNFFKKIEGIILIHLSDGYFYYELKNKSEREKSNYLEFNVDKDSTENLKIIVYPKKIIDSLK